MSICPEIANIYQVAECDQVGQGAIAVIVSTLEVLQVEIEE